MKAEPGSAPPTPSTASGFKTQTRIYLIAVLLGVATMSQIDRQVINILAEPIKQELHLRDWQLGALTGFSFAVFYATLGLPIARLADRSSRTRIIAGSIIVWSAFTIASGWVQTFGQLVLARIGVATGEAGSAPSSHSLIADVTTPHNRASSLAIYSLGTPIGALLGYGLGGLVADRLGWRMAFVACGLPGLFLGALTLLTLKDPRRIAPRSPGATAREDGAARQVGAFKALRGKRTFWWTCAGATFTAFLLYSQGAFYGSFFMRNHGAALSAAAPDMGVLTLIGLGLGLIQGVGGFFGVLTGGLVTDRATRRDMRAYLRTPALAMALGAPFYAAILLAPTPLLAGLMLAPPFFFQGVCFGPAYATVQTIVRPEHRATAAAVFLFLTSLLGLGLGPLTVGALSDLFSAHFGAATGLKYAMLSVCPAALLASACYFVAQRTLLHDLELETR